MVRGQGSAVGYFLSPGCGGSFPQNTPAGYAPGNIHLPPTAINSTNHTLNGIYLLAKKCRIFKAMPMTSLPRWTIRTKSMCTRSRTFRKSITIRTVIASCRCKSWRRCIICSQRLASCWMSMARRSTLRNWHLFLSVSSVHFFFVALQVGLWSVYYRCCFGI